MIKNKDDLDHLYFNQLRIGKYKQLVKVLKKILFTISHGQALVERGFSLNKTMLKDNIEQTSVICRSLTKYYLVMKNVKPYTTKISNQLILDIKSSRMKYESYLEEQKKSNKLQEKNKLMNIKQNEEKDLQVKIEQLLSTTKFLDEEFLTLVEKAHNKQNIYYLF